MPYIINKNTLALIPFGKKTKVLEAKELIVNENATSIISNNCILNGSTLEGRQQGSRILINSKYKPPIIINNDNLIFIPTHSSRNEECVWISLHGIASYYKNNRNGTTVEFTNKKKIKLNISFKIFDNQILRATRLESIIRARNNQNSL